MSADVLVFDGKTYSTVDILPTLRKAASAEVPTNDPDIVFDPSRWVMAFVRALKGSPLAPALRRSPASGARAIDRGGETHLLRGDSTARTRSRQWEGFCPEQMLCGILSRVGLPIF